MNSFFEHAGLAPFPFFLLHPVASYDVLIDIRNFCLRDVDLTINGRTATETRTLPPQSLTSYAYSDFENWLGGMMFSKVGENSGPIAFFNGSVSDQWVFPHSRWTMYGRL